LRQVCGRSALNWPGQPQQIRPEIQRFAGACFTSANNSQRSIWGNLQQKQAFLWVLWQEHASLMFPAKQQYHGLDFG